MTGGSQKGQSYCVKPSGSWLLPSTSSTNLQLWGELGLRARHGEADVWWASWAGSPHWLLINTGRVTETSRCPLLPCLSPHNPISSVHEGKVSPSIPASKLLRWALTHKQASDDNPHLTTGINLRASSQTPIISFYLRNLQQINFLQHLHLSRIWTIMLQSYQDKQHHRGSLISSGNRPKIIHG